MPYIKLIDRLRTMPADALRQILPDTAGELNYALTVIILNYLKVHLRSYATFNEIIGVLECIKQELYRREIAPYEDRKKEENVDVY